MDPAVFDRIAQSLADIGAISLEDYLDGHCPPPPQPPTAGGETADGNAITRLHRACQRAFRNTDALNFEFIDTGSTNKQCILSIARPDGVRRSYATQPVFAKKSDAKLEAAKIAIDMGALDFVAEGDMRPLYDLSSAPSDAMSPSSTVPESFVDDIEKCCLEWRASLVIPHWVPFFDPKLPQRQGCALRIQLSPHVARTYLSDPTFDSHLNAKGACAKAAVDEGVLEFIKHGNGQTRPSSPLPPTPSISQLPPVKPKTPWTLQAFYDSLPRPFPEPFSTNDASEINPLGWMNNMLQIVRGGKLVLSFFFTSDGPPGLHGCILKLDRPGEYKAALVDARFPKRSDAKGAACLQAMSEGIGNYIRSIAATLDNKVTPAMRSFSSGVVYPALTSGLNKIETDLHPRFEYTKERDAFGATMVVRLSMVSTADQVRRYTVPSDYRSKAEAKAAVVCQAAEQGVVEFVRFRGGPPPDGYVSPYSLHTFDADAFRKRKQPMSADEAEQSQPAKKKKKKGKRRSEATSQGQVSRFAPAGPFLSILPSGDPIHGISGPGDMGPLQSIPTDGSGDPSRSGVGGGSGSGATRPAAYDRGASHPSQTYPSYPVALDPRLSRLGRGFGIPTMPDAFGGPSEVDVTPTESGPSRAQPGSSARAARRSVEDAELEPGEVVSSAESEFSVSSSRNEDAEELAHEREPDPDVDREGVVDEGGSDDKGKAKETFLGGAPTSTITATANHAQNLIDFCARHGRAAPLFHELQREDRFLVWIVIGRERYDLPSTYKTPEEGRQRVAKQVLARLVKGVSG